MVIFYYLVKVYDESNDSMETIKLRTIGDETEKQRVADIKEQCNNLGYTFIKVVNTEKTEELRQMSERDFYAFSSFVK